jgi:hypothetical protein
MPILKKRITIVAHLRNRPILGLFRRANVAASGGSKKVYKGKLISIANVLI